MRGKIITIAVMLAAAVGLGVLVLLNERGGESPPIASGPAPLTHLFSYEAPPEAVHIQGPGREPFTLLTLEVDPQIMVVSDSTIPGMEDLPLDTVRISSVLSASRNLTYLERVLESVENPEDFGLQNPRGLVRFDFGEHGQRELRIGALAPGNIGVYIQLDDDPAVYLSPVHTLDNFLLGSLDYMNMAITPLVSWPLDFDRMTFGGSIREETGEIVVEYDGNGEHIIAHPIRHEIDVITGPGVLYSVFGLQAAGIALAHPTTEELEILGLYPAFATIAVEGEGESGSFILHASRPDYSGMFLLYREGIPLVYRVTDHEMHWLEVQLSHLMLPFAVSPSIYELSSIRVLDGQEGFEFAIVAEDESLTLIYGGQGLDDGNFRRFFSTLTGITAEYTPYPPGQPLDEAVVSFIYTYRDGRTVVVNIYPSGVPLRHYIRIDGGMVMLTPSIHLERVLADTRLVAAGEMVEGL